MHEYFSEKFGHIVRKYSQREIEKAIEDGVKYQCSWCGSLYYPDEQRKYQNVCPEKGCGGYMRRLYW